jgi:hypothetical protein
VLEVLGGEVEHSLERVFALHRDIHPVAINDCIPGGVPARKVR